MNIFVLDLDPKQAAVTQLDKHVVKMPLESAQMLSIVYSEHYWGIGSVMKVDGTPFLTKKGAFKNHPCTQWAAAKLENCAWLIMHGLGLCDEFGLRFGRDHGLMNSLFDTKDLFVKATGEPITIYHNVDGFARAMATEHKTMQSIDDITAYRKYVDSKPWVYENYLRMPQRRPDWLSPRYQGDLIEQLP